MEKIAGVVSSPYVTETVWNGGHSATAISNDGLELKVGSEGRGWSPEQLLVLAAETSLMESVLAVARDMDVAVLGYVSSSHLEVSTDPRALPRVSVRPCLVVGSPQDADRAETMLKEAAFESIIAKLLGEQLHVRVDIRLE